MMHLNVSIGHDASKNFRYQVEVFARMDSWQPVSLRFKAVSFWQRNGSTDSQSRWILLELRTGDWRRTKSCISFI